MRFLLTLALIALFAFLLGRAVDTEIASGQPQATARSLLYPRHRPLEQMSLPQLERFQVRAHAHYRGALAAHEKAASRRALSRVEWTHRRWYAAAVGWTSRELAETRARLRPPLGPSWLVNGFLCIHRYEGAWNANTGNGYFGGLQMDY
ncbi:MAG TPA: hypothetical protein VNI55_01370, partial [Gaiellaceae bacterium]|nr:hypothetical protein [Gaiellaceae bacterium]